MLAKQYRLPANTRLRNYNSFNSSLFSLKTTNNNLELNRFAFIIGKKTDKRAVVRNRMRRLFRSCIEEMLGEIKAGHDLLFSPKSQILEIERKELYNQIHDFLRGEGFLK